MVHYVYTPWRRRADLLEVRRQFYPGLTAEMSATLTGPAVPPTPDAALRRREKQQAVSRVSVWMQRGGCPHMVESTALLVAAILSDEESGPASAYAVRAAYSTAFGRFVTGLLDGQQDKQHKMSMYSIAKTIGLPATFVELRHQATHEQLPSLTKLRAATRVALDWIWGYFWKHLVLTTGPAAAGYEEEEKRGSDYCKVELLRHFGKEDEEGGQGMENDASVVNRLLSEHGADVILEVLTAIGDDALLSEDYKMLARTVHLSREVATSGKSTMDQRSGRKGITSANHDERMKDIELLREELGRSRDELRGMLEEEPRAEAAKSEPASDDDGPGWYIQEGWRKTPIGCS